MIDLIHIGTKYNSICYKGTISRYGELNQDQQKFINTALGIRLDDSSLIYLNRDSVRGFSWWESLTKVLNKEGHEIYTLDCTASDCVRLICAISGTTYDQ